MVSRIGYSAVSSSIGSSCSTTWNGAGLPRLTGSVSHSLACRNRVPFRLVVRARPLHAAEPLELLVAHARGAWATACAARSRAPRGWGCPSRCRAAAASSRDDLDVVAGARRRVDRLADPLHAALAAGDGALGLAPGGRAGQHHVRRLGGVGQEDVLHHQALQALEELAGAVGVRLGAQRVLADDVGGGELAFLHRLEHLRQVHALLGVDRHAVLLAEPPAGVVVGLDVLEAGQLVRDGAHVAAALDVVLAAQRHQAGAVAPHVTGEQRQVDQRQHVVGRVVVLGDAERPADLRPVGPGVVVGELA